MKDGVLVERREDGSRQGMLICVQNISCMPKIIMAEVYCSFSTSLGDSWGERGRRWFTLAKSRI